MIVVLSIALGLAALRSGGMLASAALSIAAAAILADTIIAFVGRGHLQCFAIGFLIPLVAYAALHLAAGDGELDPYVGKLPTTRLLQPTFETFVRREWIDLLTGEPIPDYRPADNPVRHQGGGALPPGVSPVTRSEAPDRRTFMALGHTILAMLIAYVGGKFAIAVRRHQEATEN